LIAEAWNKVQQIYVDRTALGSQQMTYGAISGMVDALGDTGHSRFLSPQMVAQEREAIEGQFEGVGIHVETKQGRVVIVAPIDGSPAHQAGVLPGDVIMQVDGQDVTGVPLDEVVRRVRGPAGTKVTLTILTPETGRVREFTLTRAKVALRNVAWQRLPDTSVAHLRIAAFSQGVTEDLRKALREIRQERLTALILDLRSNPGGLLEEAVGTASQFLASGDVLLERNAKGETSPVPVKAGGLATDIPLVVLINAGTASGAEIVAGAIQDAGRAILLGETTFGAGTVLKQYPLSDGSALLLATEEWLTPKRRVIWKMGIAPDVQVRLSPEVTLVFPTAGIRLTAAQLRSSGDEQLLQALELIGP